MQLIPRAFVHVYKINWSLKPNEVYRSQLVNRDKEQKGATEYREEENIKSLSSHPLQQKNHTVIITNWCSRDT